MRARCTRRTGEGGRFHSIGMIRLDGGRDSILATAYGGRMDPKGRLMTDGYTSIEHRDPLAESLGDSDLPSEGRLDVEPAEEAITNPVEEPAAKSGQPVPKPKPVPHLTLPERAARGKAARAEVPRSAQAEIDFPKRRDPVALLEEQAVSRLPELVPIRYGRMLVSPFAFYRGGALIMASDLARTPNSGKERRKIVLDTVRSYRQTVAVFAGMSNLDVWYSSLPVQQALQKFTRGVDPKRLKKVEANLAKARTKDSMHAFEKLTHVVDGERRIISDPPLIVPIDELIPASMQRHEIVGEIQGLVRSYRQT